MITVSIIGTAGRNGLYRQLTSDMYSRACSNVEALLGQIATAHNTTIDTLLIKSGGAALSDHIAVRLFRNKVITKLHLHLPCDFRTTHITKPQFISSNLSVARSANHHHHNFSQQIEIDSLAELSEVLSQEGVSFDVSNGFFARNRKIAQCDYLIALIFQTKLTHEPSPQGNHGIISQVPPHEESRITPAGGTGNTWRQASSAGRILLAIS